MILYILLILSILVIIPTMVYIAHKLYPDYISSPRYKYIYYLILAIIFILLCIYGIDIYTDINTGIGNFLLHAIGGGCVGFCIYLYIVGHYRYHIDGIIHFILFMMFLQSLGVANEILEFVLEYNRLGTTIMSFSSRDTWLDLVANNTGGVIIYIVYVAHKYSIKS